MRVSLLLLGVLLVVALGDGCVNYTTTVFYASSVKDIYCNNDTWENASDIYGSPLYLTINNGSHPHWILDNQRYEVAAHLKEEGFYILSNATVTFSASVVKHETENISQQYAL